MALPLVWLPAELLGLAEKHHMVPIYYLFIKGSLLVKILAHVQVVLVDTYKFPYMGG